MSVTVHIRMSARGGYRMLNSPHTRSGRRVSNRRGWARDARLMSIIYRARVTGS